MHKTAVFLDRDGVINVCARAHDYIKSWEEFRFLPGVGTAIARLKKMGALVFIVTNQRGVARGLMSIEDIHEIHQHMVQELALQGAHIDGIFICPHEVGTCHCRKPDIGLFLQAERKYSFNKDISFMIGDSISDILAGENYGVRTISVGNKCSYGGYHCNNLTEAVAYILGAME